jgi:hypothetical protein
VFHKKTLPPKSIPGSVSQPLSDEAYEKILIRACTSIMTDHKRKIKRSQKKAENKKLDPISIDTVVLVRKYCSKRMFKWEAVGKVVGVEGPHLNFLVEWLTDGLTYNNIQEKKGDVSSHVYLREYD